LCAKDLQATEKIVSDLQTAMKRSKDHKKEEEELDLINRVIEMLKVNAFVKDGEWSAKDVDFLNKHLFLTSKPVIYLVNIGKEEYIKK
jgi:obg-like ATPase 1